MKVDKDDSPQQSSNTDGLELVDLEPVANQKLQSLDDVRGGVVEGVAGSERREQRLVKRSEKTSMKKDLYMNSERTERQQSLRVRTASTPRPTVVTVAMAGSGAQRMRDQQEMVASSSRGSNGLRDRSLSEGTRPSSSGELSGVGSTNGTKTKVHKSKLNSKSSGGRSNKIIKLDKGKIT